MKTKFVVSLIALFSLIMINEVNAQLPSEYPFRSKIDGNGFIYVTGFKPVSGINQILIEKYDNNGLLWFDSFSNPFGDGNDKGMDVVIDEDLNEIYVAGYIYNEEQKCDNIILLKYNSSGTLEGEPFIYDSYLDSRALAIAIDEYQDIYLCGYIGSENEDKNFITMKFDNSLSPLWEEPEIFDAYPGDDIATSILVDKGHVYVLGYSWQGDRFGNDILLLTYDKNGSLTDSLVFNNGGNEKPTSFIFAEKSDNPVVKSKTVTGGYLEMVYNGNPNRKYFTYYFSEGPNNQIIWTSTYGGTTNFHASTSTARKDNGDIVVTGYTYNGNNQYDFGTRKLNKNNGSVMWTLLYDKKDPQNVSGDDKASSVAIDSRGAIYVTGYSQYSTPQYVTIKYLDDETPVQDWVQGFAPDFSGPIPNPQYASEIHIDHEDNVILLAMNWNDSEAQYDIVKYDKDGNELFTLGEGSSSFSSAPGMMNSPVTVKSEGITIFENYPNPFNPVTTIRYNLMQSGNIEIKLFNSLGQLVKNIFSGYQAEGYKEQVVDASTLSSGMYYYIVKGNGFNEVRKISLVK